MDFTETTQQLLRTEALEKEIQRLKVTNQTQSGRIHRLRKLHFFSLLFFGVLLLMLYMNGLLQWPEDTESTRVLAEETQAATTFEPDVPEPKKNLVIPEHLEDGLIFKVPDNGVLFSVQIGAYASIELGQFELNLLSLQQYSYEGINQYTAGLFTDYEQAKAFLAIIKQMGFEDAHIISTRHGKRLPLQQALLVGELKATKPDTPSQPSGNFLDQTVVIEEFAGQNP